MPSISAESAAKVVPERRQRRRPGENRARLIEAGIAEFALRGYNGASTSAIATIADVPQPHIYANFRTKQELFLACWERVYHELLQSHSNTKPLIAVFFAQAAATVHEPAFSETSLRGNLLEIRTVLGTERLRSLLEFGFDELLELSPVK